MNIIVKNKIEVMSKRFLFEDYKEDGTFYANSRLLGYWLK